MRQVDAAIDFLLADPDRWQVDPDHLVLAGDSAGAHIAAQAALAISDEQYPAEAGLPAPIAPDALRATILCSGAFDPRLADAGDPTWGLFLRTVLWAYSGQRDFERSDAFAHAALPAYVSADYPPSFVTTGPYDPLLDHSPAMVTALQDAGAEVDTLFFDAATTDPAVGHEYQMDLRTPQAREAMERIVAHVRAYTTSSYPGEGISDTS